MKEYGVLKKSSYATPERLSRGGGWNPDKKAEKPLLGEIQGQRAAQGEERAARSIEKSIRRGFTLRHFFRWTTLKRGTVGYKELDELVFTLFGPIAISIKGEDFTHLSAASKAQDKLNEIIILQQLRSYGIGVREIISVSAKKLKTQEDADKEMLRIGIR